MRGFSPSHRGACCQTAELHHLGRSNGRVEGLRRLVATLCHYFDVLERIEKGAHADLNGIGSRLRVDDAHTLWIAEPNSWML